MKFRFLFLFSCLWLWLGTITAQSAKTIHQTFTLDGAQKVNINVVGNSVEMRETKGSRVLIEMTVKLSVPNDRLLDFVVNSGRYDLEKLVDAATGELTISSKRTNNVIMIKGKEAYEEISYIVYIPASIKYANNSTIQETGGG